MLPDSIAIHSSPAALIKNFLTGRKFTKIGVLVDEHTLTSCYPLLEGTLPHHEIIVVPAGEEYKTIESCLLIWQKLTDFSFDRHSCLIAIGGGVIGDMGGFCAATFKRGIAFLLMPTTLLAQADASIGGKTGIDFQHYKNHIGLFQEPIATLIGLDFLKTLPLRELRSGFAEIVKHCIISDERLWRQIASLPLMDQNWEKLIHHSVEFKSSVVKQDPREKGLRKVLNFGHSIGHAIESQLLSEGSKIFHGEAIAAGMIAESFVAVKKDLLSEKELDEISRYIFSVFGKIKLPDTSLLLPIMLQDKKNKGDQILMALPEGIGKAVWDISVNEDEINAALAYYANAKHN